jgi:hypothetical protein
MEKVMNKVEFVKHVAQQHQCTQIEAEKTIDMFTSSVINVIGQGKAGYILFDNNMPADRWDVMYLFANGVFFDLDSLLKEISNEQYRKVVSMK